MKKLLTLLLLTTISFAQNISITKSDIFKDKKKHSLLTLTLEDNDGGIVTIREYHDGLTYKLKGYYIQYFDSNLKQLKELDYEVKDKTIKNAFLKDNKIHLIEIEELKKEKKIAVNVSTSDIKNLNFTTKNLLIFSEENIKDYFGVFLFPFFINNGFSQADANHMGEVRLSANNKFFAIVSHVKTPKT